MGLQELGDPAQLVRINEAKALPTAPKTLHLR
jgi:hypothetical protein